MNYSIALTLIKGIGPARANQLIQVYGDAQSVFSVPAEELHREGHIPMNIAERFSYSLYEQEVDGILQWCDANRVTVIYQTSDLYPPLLAEIYDPPTVLYGMGDISLLKERSVAIVGMRKISDYGVKATDRITDGLCQAGIVITSGLAYGADAAAHESALRHHGKTIAVMATGPDRVYPAAHRDLAARILGTGAVITEYPPGSEGHKYCFVQRNRIISGMSEATVVIEAAHKSGSLITSDFALSQGREVFAVPGSIFSGCSEGTNELIAAGATPALSAKQVLEQLGGDESEKDIQDSEQLTLFENTVPEYLSPDEATVLEILSFENTRRIDDISDTLGASYDALFEILLSLELNSLIQQIPGGGYRRI